jgi:hypothetical protein
MKELFFLKKPLIYCRKASVTIRDGRGTNNPIEK